MANLSLTDALAGCLLGAAIGDAVGLPYEGLSRRCNLVWEYPRSMAWLERLAERLGNSLETGKKGKALGMN